MNALVVSFILAISVLAALAFGLVPALAIRRNSSLMRRDRCAGASHNRTRAILAGAQVALALVLCAGAGLIAKSLGKLMDVETGFEGARLLTMQYRLPRNNYPESSQQARFHYELTDRVSQVPGVISAAVVRTLPFGGIGVPIRVELPDRPEPPRGNPYFALGNAVTSGYFETAGIPLIAGRTFRTSDTAESARVVVVNREFAQRHWPGESALDRQVRIPSEKGMAPAAIIGVVGDVKHSALDEPQRPQLYQPYSQAPFVYGSLVVRAAGDPSALTRAVQRAVWSLDKDLPVWAIRTLAQFVDATLNRRRFVLVLMGVFSAAALLLAAVGLYGVLAYGVSQRSGEFGIRMALGARPADILAMVARSGAAIVGVGTAIGLLTALPLARLIRTQLYAVSEMDPLVYATVAGVLLAVAAPAVLLPARRATRIDPVSALRRE
jgi:putative ABC transport system permease protein